MKNTNLAKVLIWGKEDSPRKALCKYLMEDSAHSVIGFLQSWDGPYSNSPREQLDGIYSMVDRLRESDPMYGWFDAAFGCVSLTHGRMEEQEREFLILLKDKIVSNTSSVWLQTQEQQKDAAQGVADFVIDVTKPEGRWQLEQHLYEILWKKISGNIATEYARELDRQLNRMFNVYFQFLDQTAGRIPIGKAMAGEVEIAGYYAGSTAEQEMNACISELSEGCFQRLQPLSELYERHYGREWAPDLGGISEYIGSLFGVLRCDMIPREVGGNLFTARKKIKEAFRACRNKMLLQIPSEDEIQRHLTSILAMCQEE